MSQFTKIQFEIPISQRNDIHDIAKRKGISDADYCRQMIHEQVLNAKVAQADRDLDKIVRSKKFPKLHTVKEFKKWLEK